jgi:hypothetical protein
LVGPASDSGDGVEKAGVGTDHDLRPASWQFSEDDLGRVLRADPGNPGVEARDDGLRIHPVSETAVADDGRADATRNDTGSTHGVPI